MNALIDISTWEDDRMADYGGYTRKCGKIDENGTRWMVKFGGCKNSCVYGK